MCTKKIYRPQWKLNSVPPGSASTTLEIYRLTDVFTDQCRPIYTLVGTPERPCMNPPDALAVPVRYTFTLYGSCRVPLGIHTGTGRAPVTFSENEDKSLYGLPGTRRDLPGLRQGICKARFDHDHSARGPPDHGRAHSPDGARANCDLSISRSSGIQIFCSGFPQIHRNVNIFFLNPKICE